MDWPRGRFDVLPHDRDVFQYEPQQSKVLRILQSNTATAEWPLSDDHEWNEWFSKEHFEPNGRPEAGVGVILAARPEDDVPEDEPSPGLLEVLPFSEPTFETITERFYIHGSVVRVINRGYAFFSRTHTTVPTPAGSQRVIVYMARTSQDWPGDHALAMTYFRDSGFTRAVFLGCSDKTARQVQGRLEHAEDAIVHPLLLVGILAELEHTRQISLVTKGVKQLLETVTLLSKRSTAWKFVAQESDGSTHAGDAMHPWLQIHYLKNGIENWKEQLMKMADHVDELNKMDFAAQEIPPAGSQLNGKFLTAADILALQAEENRKSGLRRTGLRIKERLLEISDVYNEKVKECVMIMEGMSLATQLAHTKANMEIALATKKDSSQMRSIALLTMVFLPGTFVATILSTSFFEWKPSEGSLISSWFWVYWVFSGGLTAITLGLWYFFVAKKKFRIDNDGSLA